MKPLIIIILKIFVTILLCFIAPVYWVASFILWDKRFFMKDQEMIDLVWKKE